MRGEHIYEVREHWPWEDLVLEAFDEHDLNNFKNIVKTAYYVNNEGNYGKGQLINLRYVIELFIHTLNENAALREILKENPEIFECIPEPDIKETVVVRRKGNVVDNGVMGPARIFEGNIKIEVEDASFMFPGLKVKIPKYKVYAEVLEISGNDVVLTICDLKIGDKIQWVHPKETIFNKGHHYDDKAFRQI